MEQKCKLCMQRFKQKRRPWDEIWDERCAESICKLLRIDYSEFGDIIRRLVYCSPCHQLIRDIDYTVRTLASLKQKSLYLRTTLSQMLIPNLELLGHDDCDSAFCYAARRKSTSAAATLVDPDPAGDCPSPTMLPISPIAEPGILITHGESDTDDVDSEPDPDIIELPFPGNRCSEISCADEYSGHPTTSTDDMIVDVNVPANPLETPQFNNPQVILPFDQKEYQILESVDIRCFEEIIVEDEPDAEGSAREANSDCMIIEAESSNNVDPSGTGTETSGPRRSQRIKNKPNYQQDAEEGSDQDSDFDPDQGESSSAEEEILDSDISDVDADGGDRSVANRPRDRLVFENASSVKIPVEATQKASSRNQRRQTDALFIRRARNRLIAPAPAPSNPTTVSTVPYWPQFAQFPYTTTPEQPAFLIPNVAAFWPQWFLIPQAILPEQPSTSPVLNYRLDPYICEIDGCTFRTWSEDWLDVHKIEHQISTKPNSNSDEPNINFECPVCKLNFLKLEVYKSHMDRVHRPTTGDPTHIQCPLCSKTFGKTRVMRKEFYNFKNHFNSIHVPRDPKTDNRRFKYLCPIWDCRSRCRTRKYLEIHHRKCHEGDPRPFKCEECSKGFRNRTLLAIHKAKHHAAVPAAVCHICGTGFSHKGRLIGHIKDKHPEAETFVCKFCSWTMYYQDDCEAHEKLHKPNSFSCVVNKCYINRSNDHGSFEGLTRHVVEAHSSLLRCTQCNYATRQKLILKSHMVRHTKEKPFLCKLLFTLYLQF